MTSNSDLKKVVLIGASGNLGAIILPALLAAKNFQITALSRSSNVNSFPPEVKVVNTAYTESKLEEIFKGQDVVISAVGATGFAEQKVFIDAAVKAGVKRFIPSELSSNTLSDSVRELVPVFEPKKAVLDYLKEKEDTGLTWTGLAVGPLLDWGIVTGFLGFDLQSRTATIWDDGQTAFSATNQSDVGKAVVSVLNRPAETANRYLYIHTLVASQADILRSLERAGEEWTVQKVKTDEQIALGRHKASQGDFTGMFELVKASAWGKVKGIRSNYAVDEQLANSTLGLPEGDLDITIKQLLDARQ